VEEDTKQELPTVDDDVDDADEDKLVRLAVSPSFRLEESVE
jgi:hypothetical protein